MPFIYSFCTWFSIRLGSIIVAVFSIIQAVGILIADMIAFYRCEEIAWLIEETLSHNDMMYSMPYLEYLQHNMESVTEVIMICSMLYIISCILLIYSALRLNFWGTIPYVASEFIRLVIISYTSATTMILVKKNVLDFNILIVCLMSGAFIILLLCYFWLCPLSLAQCIWSLNQENKIKANKSVAKDIEQLSIYLDYLNDFKIKPIMPNRNYHQYQYGNLPALHF